MMVLKEKNTRIAVFVSILTHIILLSIFALIKLTLRLDIPEFTEITFVSGRNEIPAALTAKESAQSSESLTEEQKEASEVVKLPIRKMLDQEEPLLKVTDLTKQIPKDVQTLPGLNASDNKKERSEALLTGPLINEKETALPAERISPDQKLLPITSTAMDNTGQTPYQIEGQAARRIVTYKVIPKYPENLQKQALIKISFTVLPNGYVGEMIPVIKSDAQLEKITLEALRQWRFNPLPADSPQRAERGIITFRYLLK